MHQLSFPLSLSLLFLPSLTTPPPPLPKLWSCDNFTGQGIVDYALGFYFCYGIALLSFTIGKQQSLDEYGIGYAVWSILIGMLVTNVIVPCLPTLGKILEPISGSGEFFIKVALVNIASNFSEVEAVVSNGLLSSWPKIPLNYIVGWYLGTRVFKIENKELIVLVITAYTICGTSACAAVGVAIGSSKDNVNVVIAMCSLITIPFMLAVPYMAKALDLTDEVAGGWIGTGVDNTGELSKLEHDTVCGTYHVYIYDMYMCVCVCMYVYMFPYIDVYTCPFVICK
jgi:uncharacterized membrane protein YadS